MQADGPLVFGAGRTAGDRRLALWTAMLGETFGCEVVVVHALARRGIGSAFGPFDRHRSDAMSREGEDDWERVVDEVAHERVTVEADAGDALVDEAARRSAALVVVGRSSREGGPAPSIGPVAATVLNASSTPVAVVPTYGPVFPIAEDLVVGVDGSASSLRAVRWATGSARALGVGIYLLCVLSGDLRTEAAGLAGRASADPESETLAALRGLAEKSALGAGTKVASDLLVGHAAQRLMAAVHPRSMLVIGRTGTASTHDEELGSTAHACAAGSDAPVVVVP